MKHPKHKRGSTEVNLGFQIAPMIDVVFVILLYFMVMAGAVQKENVHNTKIPGTVQSDTPIDTPDEIAIKIEDDGQVYLNDDPLDAPDSKDLRELAANLIQLKQSSDASGAKVLVTIYAAEEAKYQRVIDVLDALGRAQLGDVTFQAGSPE